MPKPDDPRAGWQRLSRDECSEDVRPMTNTIESSPIQASAFPPSQPNSNMNTSKHYAALIGIDWADKSHAIALRDTASGNLEETSLDSNPNAVSTWINELRDRYQGQDIAICVELSRGALVSQLASFEFIHLYPLNPVTSAFFRKAFTPSGAKDDPSDALRHLGILEHHMDQLNRWQPSSPIDQRLLLLCENRRKLVTLQVDLRNKITSALKDYFPQALDYVGDDVAAPMGCAFILKWGDLASLKRAQPETIRKFYYTHGSRSKKRIENRLKSIKEAEPVSDDPALVEPSRFYVQVLAKQLQALCASIKAAETMLEETFQEHPDASLWQSLPGAGAVIAPRLAIAWGSDRRRFTSVQEMQTYSGIAPVRSASGKRETIFRRNHHPRFLHQSFWEHAKLSALHCEWAKAYVERQVTKGKRRSSAYRSLAFKWQRIMYAMWASGKPYDEAYYQWALGKSGSPLAKPEEEKAVA